MNKALYLEGKVAYQVRRKLSRILFALMLIFISMTFTSLILELPFLYTAFFQICFLITLCLYVANNVLRLWFKYEYRKLFKNKRGISVEAALTHKKGENKKDHVLGLINSPYGHHVFTRLGIKDISVQHFLDNKTTSLPKVGILSPWYDLGDHVLQVYDGNNEFAEFIRNQRVTRDDLFQGGKFVQEISASRFGIPLSTYHQEILNQEHKKGILFTTQAIRALRLMDEKECTKTLEHISEFALSRDDKMIYISDIVSPNNVITN